MTSPAITNLMKLIDGPRDGAMLRYSLGNEWLKSGDPAQAARFFREAVTRDPNYSAAWKLLGKSLADNGDSPGAIDAYRQGIAAATTRGDVQAAKEMGVFLRRLEKAVGET
jgi:Tfp pilus assembly protein PilF